MIRLGLVGLGKWGRNYAETISQMSSCTLTYICANTHATLKAYTGRYNKTTRYQDLIKYKSEIDGVIIATPAASHFTIARDFISHGIAVLVEKPFTTNLEDALTLEKLAGKNDIPVMVGHEYLFNPAFTCLKSSLRMLGKLNYIQTEAGNWGPFRNDASVLWDYGPHDVAMITHLLEDFPISLAAWGVNNDLLVARINFSLNITTFVNLNRTKPDKIRTFTVKGEKGSLVYNELGSQKLIFYSNKLVAKPLKISQLHSPLENEILSFIKLIKSRSHNTSDSHHAVKVVRILSAIETSLKNRGKTISLP